MTSNVDVDLATVMCAVGHLTRDHRVSPVGIVEAIARHAGHVPEDVDLTGFSTRKP